MPTSRRDFLRIAAAAGTAIAAGGAAVARAQPTEGPAGKPEAGKMDKPLASKKLRLLILGGTAYLGPEVVEAATSRGHSITLFNRGKTRPQLFPDLEKLHGDRDPDKGDGLKALKEHEGGWDAVIDTSGYYPRHVKASAELLAGKAGQYVFISTVSVYGDNSKAGMDETAPVGTIDDPTVENMGAEMKNYGPLKALCEQAAEKAMPGRVTSIRPGYIVGPGDWSGRFNYWPVRIRRAKSGGEVLAPGKPSDPIQMIDVRDLAEWIVRCIEQSTVGVYNAIGPKEKLEWGSVLEACKRVTKSSAELVWVPAKFLEAHAKPGDYFPIWLHTEGETAGFHNRSNARAVAKGLTFRPIDETISGFLAWYDALDEEKQRKFLTGTSIEREAELLKLWAERGTQSAPPG